MNLELTVPVSAITKDGLSIPTEYSLESWADLGKHLTHAGNSCQWWLGDWAAFGLEHFPEHVKDFCNIHGLDYGTIRNRAHVSKAIPPERRREKLAWIYHAEVSQLRLFEQTKWLTKAEADGMSAADLRAAIRREQGEHDAGVSEGKEVRFASKYADGLADWLNSRPATFWDEEPARKTIWAERLRPFAEAYRKLTGL